MATTDTNNRTKQQVADQKIVDGLTKHASTIASLVIGGTSFTTAAIIGVVQARLATSNAAQTTRATWRNAVKADKDERAQTRAFMAGLRKALHVAFDSSIDVLADFGLTPPKKHVVTPEQKAAAAAKAHATREARHTMGKKQKSKIKGTVPATTVARAATRDFIG
jgi:hypothetical protein